MKQSLTNYFYSNVVGHYESKQKEEITKLTIQYLLDNDLTEQEIKEVMFNCKYDVITPQNLPDSLWKVNPLMKEDKQTGEMYEVQDNLVKRNEFYYHPKLMLRSSLPKIVSGREVIEPYYCEPRCRFTIDNLIDYFCETVRTDKSYMSTQYSINSIFYNLRLFRRTISIIEPIDVMLFCIDYAAETNNYSFSTFMQLQQFLGEVVKDIKDRVAHIRAYGFDKIVWRTERCLGQKQG